MECQQNVVALRRQKVPASYHRGRGRAIETRRFIHRFAALDFFTDFNLAGAQSLKQFCGATFAGAHAVDLENGLALRQRSGGKNNQ